MPMVINISISSFADFAYHQACIVSPVCKTMIVLHSVTFGKCHFPNLVPRLLYLTSSISGNSISQTSFPGSSLFNGFDVIHFGKRHFPNSSVGWTSSISGNAFPKPSLTCLPNGTMLCAFYIILFTFLFPCGIASLSSSFFHTSTHALF